MANEFNPVVKLYYEELFSNLDFYLSNIYPGDESLQESSPTEIKEHGLFMSAEVIADQYPKLAELFAQTSIIERYNYLLDKLAQEYRSNVEGELAHLVDKAEAASERLDAHSMAKPSSWDNIKSGGAAERDWKDKLESLELRYQEDSERCADFQKYFLYEPVLACDADAYGRSEIKELFLALDRAYLDFSKNEIDIFVEHSPEAMYERLTLSYSTEFVAEIGSQLKNALNDLDTTKQKLERHDADKPDLLANVVSFGGSVEKWDAGRNEILNHIESSAKLVELNEGVRSQLLEEGRMSRLARESGESCVQSLHPELLHARNEMQSRRWAALRQEQVRYQESRDDDREIEPDQEQLREMKR